MAPRLMAATLGAVVLACWPTRAHDLWLVPSTGYTINKPAEVRAHSGMDFPESEQAPDPARFRRRLLVKPDGTEDELRGAGTRAQSGLLQFTPTQAGVYALAVETEAKLITLKADAFNEYLVSEGLPHIFRSRARDKELARDATERYQKSPKALIRVGDGGMGDPCQVVGLTLEVVPLRDPFALKPGGALAVQVLFRGKPLADANLGWQHPGDGAAARGTVRSDAEGKALVPVARPGLVTIRLTHMTRPKAEGYEYESFWTTLTFFVPEPASAK